MPNNAPNLSIIEAAGRKQLVIKGTWTLDRAEEIQRALVSVDLAKVKDADLIIEASSLEKIDTAAALLLIDWLTEKISLNRIHAESLTDSHRAIFELVLERKPGEKPKQQPQRRFVAEVGKVTIDFFKDLSDAVSFLGYFFVELLGNVLRPNRFRFRETFVQLELCCVRAIPVVGLVSFLIGLVVAYIFSDQAKRYGASIFVVDGVTIAMTRELAPLIAAVVMAGRSGSAFTAQIGAMKVNQEIDAIKALGLSVADILVIPRVLALMIALPLLVVIGDVVGVLGGMFVTESELQISFESFLTRIEYNVAFRHFYLGLMKAPVFAFFIALTGCRLGLGVENNTRSVGLNTTATVVQSIVAVIIVDAIFAVIFMKLRV